MRQAVFAIFTVALATSLLAQSTPDPALNDSVSVNYVMVPFTALGPKGTPITDLRERDVTLLIDGQPVGIDLFEKSQNAPVSFSILLDGSGSMALAGKLAAARAGVQALLDNKRKGDEYALFLFDDRDVHELVPFTEDGTKILQSLDAVKPYGKTAFFDALAKLPQREELGKNPTRAIVLVSDGIDNNSRLTRMQLAAKLEGVSIPVYALAPRDPQRPKAKGKVTQELSDIEVLGEVASSTGGKLFLGTKPQHFVSAITSLNGDLRAQYLIGFPPTGKGAVRYRRITLKTADRVRSVRVRGGYNGTEPPALNLTQKPRRNDKKGS